MACTIKRNKNGEVVEVLAENGNKSLLYRNILKLPFTESAEDALMYYEAALNFKGEEMLSDINNEPILMYASLSALNQLALPNKTVYTSSYKEALEQDKDNQGVEVGFLRKKNTKDIGNTSTDSEFFVKLRNQSLKSKDQVIGRRSDGVILVTDPSANNFKPLVKVNKAAQQNTISGFINELINGNFIQPEKVPVTKLTQESTIDFRVFDMGNNEISVMAIEEGRKIGVLRLIKKGNIIQVREVRVDKDNRKKGVGRELYFTAREELGQDIYSDAFQSPEATILWESLVRDGFAERIFKSNLKENETRDRTRWNTSRGPQTLEGAPIIKGATGADPELTIVAEEYARSAGIEYSRQTEYVELDEGRAKRIAEAYELMEHNPQDPKVKEAFDNLKKQVKAQYDTLISNGYSFYLFDETNDPYEGNPWNAMRDLRQNKVMGVFATESGFGSQGLELSDNPMLEYVDLEWGYGSLDGPLKKVTANDLFRAVHDAFGHGLEGAGFRARGEENAWQAHARLFYGSALGALTTETRGQNSWLNYGKFGEQNRKAKVEDTVFADQKTGLMPEWTWQEGLNITKPKEDTLENKLEKYDTARETQEQNERANDAGTNESNDIRNSLSVISKNNVTTRGINRRNRQGNTKIQSHVLKNVTEITLPIEVQQSIKKAFPKVTTFPKVLEIKDGAVYRDLQIKGLEGVPMASSVTVYSAEKYNTMRMFVTEDGYTGITLTKEGHLGGAFSSKKSGRSSDLAQLMVIGVKEGATNIEAFDTFLPDYYTRFGFKGVSTVAFNEEFAEKNGWNYEEYKRYNNGKPDVVHFVYDGGDRATIEERLDQFDSYSEYQKEDVKRFDKNSYEDSYNYMQAEVVRRANFEQGQNTARYKLTSVPSDVKFQTSEAKEEVFQEEVIGEVIDRLKSVGLTSNIFQLTQEEITQQTVARKYEEIAEILKKERGEENVEVVTDDNGFDWYETKIESSETQNPVIAFQKSPQQIVSELIQSGEIEAHCKL